jgi:hypothetical protein
VKFTAMTINGIAGKSYEIDRPGISGYAAQAILQAETDGYEVLDIIPAAGENEILLIIPDEEDGLTE